MNLRDLAQSVWDRSDWAAGRSAAGVTKTYAAINSACDQVAIDVPYLWTEDHFRFRTQPDVEPTREDDTLSVETNEDIGLSAPGDSTPTTIGNPWVLKADLSTAATGATDWANDRTWDTRYIEIEDENGVKRTNRIRTIWIQSNVARITLWSPWDIESWGSGPFATWKIYTPEYYLPDELMEIKALQLLHEDLPVPIDIIGQDEAESIGLGEYNNSFSTTPARPFVAFRRRYEQIMAPKVAPLATANGIDWQGPDLIGSFQYITTYCWGRRASDYMSPGPGAWDGSAEIWRQEGLGNFLGNGVTQKDFSDARFMEPIFESAPSPATATVANVAAGADWTGILVTPPSVEYALGFQMEGEMHDGVNLEEWGRAHTGHSGWYCRIYRRRVSAVNTTNFAVATTAGGGRTLTGHSSLNPDFDDGFYLVGETHWSATNLGTYLDRGNIFPDVNRRLRDTHGYQSLRLYPRPEEEFEFEVRGTRRPKKLVSPQDVPRVAPEASDLIVYKALEYIYESLNNTEGRMLAQMKYRDTLSQINKRYGTAVPSGRPMRRRAVRYPTWRYRSRWD